MDASKIHVGAGTLLLNPDTDAFDLGFCSDGATLTYNGELEPIEVDQILAPVGYYVPGEECKFETILDEVTATKLKFALGYGTVTTVAATGSVKGSETIKFGGNTVLTDFVLEYRAPKRTNRNLAIVVRLYKVNISPNIEAAFKKDGKTGFKFTALAVADTTQVAGEQLGYYREETADVTGTTPTLAVSAVSPLDDATGVNVTSNITVTFNRAVHPESVNSGTFMLIKANAPQDGVACAVSRTSSNVVTIDPSSSLTASTVYVVAVSADVMALDDKTKMAANFYSSFTTA